MSAAAFIGRLGPLAAMLGIGTAIAIGSAGHADAAPRDADASSSQNQNSGPTTSRAANATRSARPAGDSASRRVAASVRANAVIPRIATTVTGFGGQAPALPALPAAARRQSAGAASVSPTAVTTSAAAVGAARSSVFRNATPMLHPSQTGQASGGVITGALNASDPDSATLTYSVTQSPQHGTVTVNGAGTYTYTADPAVAATGTTDSFQVTVSDAGSGFHVHGMAGLLNLLTFGLLGSSGHTGTATVPVSVAPFGVGNHAPTATVTVGSPDPVTGVVTGRVIGSDVDGDPLTYSGSTTTSKGAVVVGISGSFTYTPTDTARTNAASPTATPADLQDNFTVSIDDGRGGTAAAGVVVPVSPAGSTATALVAFPGAEGFGAYATGGRGGDVIYVTNLNADGPGSLQWAIDQPGAKYILFKVSGVINTQIHLTNGDVTIAGQTSPGGITVRGFVTDETPYQDQAVQMPADFAENWILQHIRIRPGTGDLSDDGLRIRYTRNAIVDHVSIGNANDEAIEISYSHDITVQNTIIAETIGGHSFYGGVLMNYSNPAYGFGLDNVSLHHNVFNRIEGRLPEGSRESLAAARSYMNLEMSNNLYWDPNFFVALGPDSGSLTDRSGNPYPIYWNLNAVNNYFRVRDSFPYGMFDDQIMRTSLNHLYVSGNKMNLYPAWSDYQLFYCCNDFQSVTDPDTGSQVAQKLSSRNPFPSITYTPTDQLVNLLLNTAGAWPRDPMDIRLMRNVATDTIASDPRNTNPAGDALLPAYSGAAPTAPTDTDNDGMPDSWEIARGLDPNIGNTNAHNLSSVGYTDLEVYLQELSTSRITGWAG
ncbi:MAG: VCBS domain-containing protein [Mycobacterium sp.]|nr:VCBS domain-containing protein [Mycobacterium sp.]